MSSEKHAVFNAEYLKEKYRGLKGNFVTWFISQLPETQYQQNQ